MKGQRLGMLVAVIVAVAAIVLLFAVNGDNGDMSTAAETPAGEATEAPENDPTPVPVVMTSAPAETQAGQATDEPATEPTLKPTQVSFTTPASKPTEVLETLVPTANATLEPTLVAEATAVAAAAAVSPAPTIRLTAMPTLKPTAEPALYGRIIGIDPGHQAHGNSEKEAIAPGSSEMKAKVSSGTSGRFTGIPEYQTNLEISLQLRDALEAEGATVVMSRETNDVDISNQERAIMMNEAGCDLVLRLHCNGSENSSANGIGLYIRATGTGAEECEAAAEVLLPAMVEATGARADGIFKRDTYTGLNWSEVPCILVEMGYMTNQQEDENLNDPAYQQLLVQGMVNGTIAYLNGAGQE